MTNEEKDHLMKVLSQKSDEIRVLLANSNDDRKEYEKLKFAFIQMLAEYTSLAERRNFADPNEIEYRYMELSGLLDI
jgi:hypothetical protein